MNKTFKEIISEYQIEGLVDYYKVLDISSNATLMEIKATCLMLSSLYYPKNSNDIENATKYFLVKQAQKTLLDPEQRTMYDKVLISLKNNQWLNEFNNKAKEIKDAEQAEETSYQFKKNKKFSLSKETWMIVAIAFFAFLTNFKPIPKPHNQELPPNKIVTIEQTKPIFNQPEKPLPKSGAIKANIIAGKAPLNIKTSSAGGHHYFIKIVDILNNKPTGTYFIRSGETIDTKVPLGTYEIKYATGVKWYGLKYLIGPDTKYSKADSTFYFYFNGFQYSGYTVELILQQNGNLRTTGILPSQW